MDPPQYGWQYPRPLVEPPHDGWYHPAPQGPRTVAAPPGTPFHQLGHTALHRWWRPIVGTLFLVATGLVLTVGVYAVWLIGHWTIVGDFTQPKDDRLFPGSTEDLAAQLTMLAILTPVVLLTVRLVQRRPAGSVVSVLNRVRWRWLGACFGAAFGFVVISYGTTVAATAA